MKAGFCHYHRYTLTLRQMRLHGCLNKNGSWCKRFEPNLDHQWWKDKIKRGRARELTKRFVKKKRKAE